MRDPVLVFGDDNHYPDWFDANTLQPITRPAHKQWHTFIMGFLQSFYDSMTSGCLRAIVISTTLHFKFLAMCHGGHGTGLLNLVLLLR